jgi:sodium-independent sulfate anion transporter 11
MGGFVYAIFGSCKDITVGPTAIMSLMTAEYARKHGEEFTRPELAVLLAFITGIVVFTFGILKLGFLIEFISVPVIAGFTSAAAITIASGQIKGVFGLTIHKEENATEVPGIVGTYIEVVENFHTIRWQDTVLALTCIVVLLLMRVSPISHKPLKQSSGSCIKVRLRKVYFLFQS